MVADAWSWFMTLGTFRIMVDVVIAWFQFHILFVIELNVVEGAVSALNQSRLLGHGQAARRLLVLLLEMDILLPQHE